MSDNSSPDEEGKKCRWDYNALYEEEEAKLADWHHSQKCLEDPVNELKGWSATS